MKTRNFLVVLFLFFFLATAFAVSPDVNVWQAIQDDVNYPFAGGIPTWFGDDNITIDFNVFDADNNRLTVDINYNAEAVRGIPGIPIITDLNLADGVCSDQDWADSPSLCKWDWNGLVADGNYYIIIEIDDGISTDYNISDSNIGIDATAPTTSWDGNHNTWQNTDANVHLTCHDVNSGCSKIQYSFSIDNFEDDWEKNWNESNNDAENPLSESTIKKKGNYSIHFGIDADKSSFDWASWHYSTLIDLSSMVGVSSGTPTEGKFIMWLYFNTIDFLKGQIGDVTFYAESSESDYFFAYLGSDKLASATWYRWELDLTTSDVNHGIEGDIDWTAINYFSLETNAKQYNANDFEFYVDDFIIESETDDSSASVLFTADGNFVLDFNSTDVTGNVGDINTFYVLIDKTTPSTSWDGNNNIWQKWDANITLTCVDAVAGCVTNYRIDADPSSNIDWSEWIAATDVNYPSPGDADGNWAVRFYSVDLAGNTSDQNTFFVLIDKTAPTISTYTPDANGTTTDSTPDFNASFTDTAAEPNSGVVSCGYKYYVDEVFQLFGSTTAVGGNCKYTATTDLTEGQSAHLDWNATDAVGNTSAYSKGFSYTYSTPAPPSPTSGGGGPTTVKYFNFTTTEPVQKLIQVIGTVGSVHEFTLEVKNEAKQPNTVWITVDENISQVVTCDEKIAIDIAKRGTINCTANLTDVNITALQATYAGDITLKSATKTETIAVKVLAFELGGLGWFAAIIKENTTAFAIAVIALLGGATLAFLGISGYFKGWQSFAATIGGGSLAFLLALAIII